VLDAAERYERAVAALTASGVVPPLALWQEHESTSDALVVAVRAWKGSAS